MELTGAQIVCESLKKLGVEVFFGIPGGQNLPLNDALGQCGIRYVLTRHERGAAHMADGYARATGKTRRLLCHLRPRRNQSCDRLGHGEHGFHSRGGDHRPGANRRHRI